MSRSLLQVVGAVLGASLLTLTGCLGLQQPSRFYLLSAQPSAETTSPIALAEPHLAIGLGPIALPKYLDRPQIATRTGPYELKFAEFERWAEPLDTNFSRILAENLAAQIPTDHLHLFPWPHATPIEYQVTVDVTDFSAQPTGQSALVAQWSIFKGEGKEALLSRKTRLGAAVGRQDYEAMVAAMSQSVADLSREIAAGLRMLASRTATR